MIDYINSQEDYRNRFHDTIADNKTKKFSQESIDFHNRFYSWEKNPVMVLYDGCVASSVLFLNYTSDGYISIINILSKPEFRGKGHAKLLLARAIEDGYNKGKRRLRMNCDNIPGTIKFYSKLGFIYWGVTASDAFYCNVPITSPDIEDLQKLKDLPISSLMDNKSSALTNRRIRKELSEDVYTNPPEYLDMNRYKFNEYLQWQLRSPLDDFIGE